MNAIQLSTELIDQVSISPSDRYVRQLTNQRHALIFLFLHVYCVCDFVLPINIAPCPAESPLVTKVDKLMAALLTNNTMINVPVYTNIIILRLDRPNINDFSNSQKQQTEGKEFSNLRAKLSF